MNAQVTVTPIAHVKGTLRVEVNGSQACESAWDGQTAVELHLLDVPDNWELVVTITTEAGRTHTDGRIVQRKGTKFVVLGDESQPMAEVSAVKAHATLKITVHTVEGVPDGLATIKIQKGRMTCASGVYEVAHGVARLEPDLTASVKAPEGCVPDASITVSMNSVSNTIQLRPWVRSLVADVISRVKVSNPTGTTKMTVDLLLTGAGPHQREVQPVDNLVYDEALHRACANCGVRAGELVPRTLESFRDPKLSEEVALHRFQQHQIDLIKKLHLVVSERHRLLLVCDETNRAISPTKPSLEDDKLVSRARRQRKILDTSEQRRKLAKEKKREEGHAMLQAAEQFAGKTQQEREDHHAQMVALHKANQQQMQKRWLRDEALATERQRRIDEEFQRKEQMWRQREESVATARTRRNEFLKEVAGTSSDESTQARLEKARELRRQVDEDIAKRARAALLAADEQREKHVYEQFVKQIDLANKALSEREVIESTLQRSQTVRDTQLQTVSARVKEADARSEAAIARQRQALEEKLQALAADRESRHATARNHRIEEWQHREQVRAERERRREQLLEERLGRLDVEAAKRHDTEVARDQHHEQVEQRVRVQTEREIAEKHRRLEERQRAAEARKQKVAEIRSIKPS